MKFIAGIVLYNPDIPRLIENINGIYKQVDEIILIDNGSLNIKLIKQLRANYQNITLVENLENKGIAIALNQIMKASIKKGYPWVLLLDQDSVCPSSLVGTFSKYININQAAIICPHIVDRNSKKKEGKITNNKAYEFVKKCITSGSFVNASVWDEVGGFDEIMFIDYVDFEYCTRIINKGYRIIKVNHISLLHEIGHKKIYKFLWFEVPTYDHSAFRKYYITRNTLYYTNKYRKNESLIVAYLKIIRRALIVTFYENDKKAKLKAMSKGFKDSFKMGKQHV